MKKTTCLKEIQKRLPDAIIVQDETDVEYTDDEYVSILSWIKFINGHYAQFGTKKLPFIQFPIISKRLRLDFGLYHISSDIEPNRGKHIIYISQNGKSLNGSIKKNLTIKEVVKAWKL